MKNVLFFAALILSPTGQAAAEAVFGSGFSTEGNQSTQGNWILVEFVDGNSSLEWRGRTDSTVEWYNQTRLIVREPWANVNHPAGSSSTERREISAHRLLATWEKRGALAILADQVIVNGSSEYAYDVLPEAASRLSDSQLDDSFTQAVWPTGPQVFAISSSGPISLLATNVRGVEWIGASVTCPESEACPTGGSLGPYETGLSLRSWERFAGDLGSLSVQASNAWHKVGATSITVDLQGVARLPHGAISNCDCPPDISGTLVLDGTMRFDSIARQGNSFQATISGDAVHVFQDGKFIGSWFAPVTAGTAAAVAVAVAVKLLLVPLFTRLGKQEALDHPKRRLIFQYVQEHPGANFREISRETDIASGTVRHHLTVLERAGHLVEHTHNGTVRLFENHGKFDHNWSDVVLLREEPLAQLHSWIKEHPQSPQKAILEAFELHGWSRSTTQHRLTRLVVGGLVTIRLQGRLKMYSAPERPSRAPPASPGSTPPMVGLRHSVPPAAMAAVQSAP